MITDDSYLNIIWAECISTFDEKKVQVGKRYRLGIRYNTLMKKQVYYLVDIKDALGIPIYVEKESGYFKEHELKSISFIMT
jgi:hypothetical protein